jgi:pimeloyl-ACP methyl ester carboxylesterase
VYAHQHPERVRGLVILNGPHPDIWGHPEIDPVQGMASEGYVPLLVGPTATLSMPVLDSLLTPHLTPEELEQYRAAWNVPDAYASMCKWYDANVYPEVTMPTGVTVSVPVLALWGMDDTFVTPSQLEHLPDYVPDLEIVKLESVDHWITHQATEILSEHIVTFEARLAKE